MDPTRLRRVGRWIRGLAAPKSLARKDRTVWWATAVYVLGVGTAAATLWWLSDRWWPATTLLFGPRWALLVPIPLLAFGALARDRALLVPLGLAALILLGPVMGFRTGWRAFLVTPDAARDLRVVSFNASEGRLLATSLELTLHGWDADIVGLQECSGAFADRVRALGEWNHATRGGLCLLSRHPIIDGTQMDNEVLAWAGGSGAVVTHRIDVNGDTILITNLHLETPRAGFERLRAGDLWSGAAKLEEKSLLRSIELRRARAWVDDHEGPHIVLGDFNTPAESPIFREAWSDWQNAFSLAGRGFGGTRLNGWIRARIDHILVNEEWQVVRARTGDDAGSDHLPVVAVLRLRSGR